MTVDELVREWAQSSGEIDKVRRNQSLLRFLGEWLFCEYQPYPEKADFWERLYTWLDQVPAGPQRAIHQQAMFNFVIHLLFAGERDLTSMYRAAYDGPIRRWLIDQANLSLETPNFDDELENARRDTWFGSLAGMDINTFCRVNRILGQSYRPEFRFINEFCDAGRLRIWLDSSGLDRIVVVEDMVGTGDQFLETIAVLTQLGKETLFVPLFIPPDGNELITTELAKPENNHIAYHPILVLPNESIIRSQEQPDDNEDVIAFREIVNTLGNGQFGFGGDYGTLALSYLNCPDNVPRIIWNPLESALFPRASREG